MKRRINVRVSSSGAVTVEAIGFRGKGCEDATKAIEDALGKPEIRTRKPDFWRQEATQRNEQKIGGDE